MSDLSDQEAISLDLLVTLDDQVRTTEYIIDQPRYRRRRWIYRTAVVLLTPVVGDWLGTSLAWLGDPRHGPYLQTLWDLGDAANRATTLTFLLLVSGALLVLFGIEWLTRTGRLRRRLRRLLRERPGVDPNDPLLAEPVHVTFGPGGFEAGTLASSTQLGWPAIKALAETPTIFMVKTGEISGFILPKRGLHPDQLDAIRRIARRHLTAPGR